MPKLTYYLKVIERYSRMFKNARLGALELVSRQAEILTCVGGHPGISQDEIADRLLINKSGITRHLTVLEEKGLVARQDSPTDRRVSLVFLTEKGKALVPAILEVNCQWKDFVTRSMTSAQEEAFCQVMKSVCDRIFAELEGGSGK